jgi:DNA invertase Pin-like site-specific DNA recombinase/peptidoglycan hydrolase-like protein with peptidoglycan-binding domain
MPSWLLAFRASAAIVLMAVGAVALGAPPTAAAAAPKTTPVLEQGTGLGSTPSAAVRRVQRILERRGFGLGPPGADGRFGPLTAAAVRRMQTRYGLAADGVVGPKTRRVLRLMAETSRVRANAAPRPAPTPRPATPARPATPPQTTAPPPATHPTTTTPAVTREAVKTDTTTPTVLAALAAVLAAAALAIALLRSRRPRSAPVLAAIDRDLYLEGHSDHPGIGAFRGFALATAVPPDAADDPRRARYLVDDPRKPAPVWVEGSDVDRSPSPLGPGEPVIGYVTADPDANAEQEAFMAIETACDQAGWCLDDIVRDQDTGRMVGRAGLTRALERIAAGEARGLVVADARRLVRSLADLGALLEWFRDAEAVLVALDLDLDTATIHGHQTASTLISVSGWEGDRVATRARRGLARVQTRDRGAVSTADERAALVERIGAMRAAGMSLQAIATQLGKEGVPPLRGAARWSPAVVRSALDGRSRTRSIRDQLPAIPAHRRS